MARVEEKKKEWKTYEIEVEVPENVTVSLENNSYILIVKADKGELKREFKYPYVKLLVNGKKVILKTERFTKRQKKIMHTYRAHIKNMIKGVTKGFEYKLKVVYAKFPMTVELKNNKINVKNFLGEKVPRTVKVYDDVKVKIDGGKDITVTGIDKERCGQMAAEIEKLTKITHLDRRVIQDGIFITEKPHVRYS
jgi:large subunit ribosomal protein L6